MAPAHRPTVAGGKRNLDLWDKKYTCLWDRTNASKKARVDTDYKMKFV